MSGQGPRDLAERIASLNPHQAAAVRHDHGPLLVVAGAGSGKTRVLTLRLARLITEMGMAPENLLAVTFTNKAGGEMRQRIEGMIGREAASGLEVGTFHSFGARLLRRYADRLGRSGSFTIADADDSRRILFDLADGHEEVDLRWLQHEISSAKSQLLSPEEYAERNGSARGEARRQASELYLAYEEALRQQNLFDFDDLIAGPVRILSEDPGIRQRYERHYTHVLVDEYQDTNHAQYRLLHLIAGGHQNLMVVGDADQGIYSWRGAEIQNLLSFERDFPSARTVYLEDNYRSTPVIVEGANAVIRNNVERKEKTLRAASTDASGAGEPISVATLGGEQEEAHWVVSEIQRLVHEDPSREWSDFAVFYRTNAQSRILENAFRREGVPYQVVGGVGFFERREIRDLMAYIKLVVNPRDRGAFERVVNVPRRGIGKKSIKRLLAWAEEHEVPPLEAARRAEEIPGIGAKPSAALCAFADLIERHRERSAHQSASRLLEGMVEEVGYVDALMAEGPEGRDRADNVGELIVSAREFALDPDAAAAPDDDRPELGRFLEHVALLSDVDTHDDDTPQASLMTVHAAKGLEFDTVFVTGLEEGVFPHGRALQESGPEEERRLFYVAMTRAERQLHLTRARSRTLAGTFTPDTEESRFLAEIPSRLIRTAGEAPSDDPWDDWGAEAVDVDPTAPAPEEDPVSAEEVNQEPPELEPGLRVRHPHLGLGTIEEVEAVPHGPFLRIAFDTGVVRRINPQVVQLRLEPAPSPVEPGRRILR